MTSKILVSKILASIFALAIVATAGPALAHTGPHAAPGMGFSFGAGLWHPLQGPDHLAQMVLVGLLAARAGGRAIWLLPLTFVAAMVAGALIVRPEMAGTVIEWGILVGLAIAGVLAVSRDVVALPVMMAAVGAAGVLHGTAHGAEAPAASFAVYVAGFVTATSLLHAVGVVGGVWLMRQRAGALQVAGAAIAVAGVAGAIV